MASERRAAANGANARKSTGPRSRGGKKRSSRNSYRHGLSARTIPNSALPKAIEKLARKLAGPATDVIALEHARTAAQTHFALAHIRQIKVDLIEQKLTLPTQDANRAAPLIAPDRSRKEADRFGEAVRLALPELLRLDRYERSCRHAAGSCTASTG